MTRGQRDQENAVMFGLAFAGDIVRAEPPALRFQLKPGTVLNRPNTVAELKARPGRSVRP